MQTALILLHKRDQKFNLGPTTLHLSDVGGYLRQQTQVDNRLEQIYPRTDPQRGNRLCLSKLLGKPHLRAYFVIKQSDFRPSEKCIQLQSELLLSNILGHVGMTSAAHSAPGIDHRSDMPPDLQGRIMAQLKGCTSLNPGGTTNPKVGILPAQYPGNTTSTWGCGEAG